MEHEGRHGVALSATALELLPLSDPRCTRTDVAGAKASVLARLLPVMPTAIPAAWVLPTAATASLLRRQEEGGADELRAALSEALHLSERLYAVRSSAVDEDASDHSFAGQYDTLLGVSSAGDVATAVATCIRSGTSERLAAYRMAAGAAEPEAGAPAVLIQELVPAERAGVAFTRHPVTGDRQTVIEAAFGLGSVVVDGRVTPDTFVVDAEGRVAESTVGSKRRMIVATPTGLEEVSLPSDMGEVPSLSTQQVEAVAAAARSCEDALGYPVDMEWAISDGRVHVLQARPITTGPRKERTRGRP